MRIFEIDNKDKTFAASSGMSLDIDDIYSQTKMLINTLLLSKSSSRTSYFIPLIDKAVDNLEWIVNANFRKDKSTKALKDKARQYLIEIQNLKNQL